MRSPTAGASCATVFYERWECGALSRDELAYYAGEYLHAVTALAGLAASASDAGHAAEEAAHVAIWDDFAAELDADLDRAPHAETVACAEAWSGTGIEGAAALFVDRSAQPGHLAQFVDVGHALVRLRAEPEGHALSTCTLSATTSTLELSRRCLSRLSPRGR